jgi:hypothetical protein
MNCQTVEDPDVPWGGKRPGAGRKARPDGKLDLLSVRVHARTLKKLQVEAKRRGITLREVIEDLARRLPEP